MSFFKKALAVIDPVGSMISHYGGKRSSSVRNWYSGLGDTLHFWDRERLLGGIKKQWSVKSDPLGNQLNKIMFPEAHSAASLSHSSIDSSIYGPTGSIIGKF